MAKGKIFSDGQPLTAADVNTYLNPDVISTGLAHNSGWQTTSAFTLPAGITPHGGIPLKARRCGLTVSLVGGLTIPAGYFPAGSTILTFENGWKPSMAFFDTCLIADKTYAFQVSVAGRMYSYQTPLATNQVMMFNQTYEIG